MDIVSGLFLTLGALALRLRRAMGHRPLRSRSHLRGRVTACGCAETDPRRHRLRHKLLRHARHRFVRDHDLPPINFWGSCLTNGSPGRRWLVTRCPWSCRRLLFITIVSVDRTLLVSLIVAMMAGEWLGAGVVSRLPRRVVRAWNGDGTTCSPGSS